MQRPEYPCAICYAPGGKSLIGFDWDHECAPNDVWVAYWENWSAYIASFSNPIDAIRADIAGWEHGYTGEPFEIVEDIPGYGIHIHDSNCADRCMRDCDNSDRIVTVCYSERGYHATYGILAGTIRLWAN